MIFKDHILQAQGLVHSSQPKEVVGGLHGCTRRYWQTHLQTLQKKAWVLVTTNLNMSPHVLDCFVPKSVLDCIRKKHHQQAFHSALVRHICSAGSSSRQTKTCCSESHTASQGCLRDWNISWTMGEIKLWESWSWAAWRRHWGMVSNLLPHKAVMEMKPDFSGIYPVTGKDVMGTNWNTEKST